MGPKQDREWPTGSRNATKFTNADSHSPAGLVRVWVGDGGHTPSDSDFGVLAAARSPASLGPQAAAAGEMTLEGASSGLPSSVALGFGAGSVPEGMV